LLIKTFLLVSVNTMKISFGLHYRQNLSETPWRYAFIITKKFWTKCKISMLYVINPPRIFANLKICVDK